ncbi:RNA 2',3'-cyclic phosphodiesterase [Massilia sp. ST3]|uniref:RNA 2',3'-cyclic phosphodiesterase n=1 Tax=Massilia sp. ST3 TaxID=2824903 RepID=UPI001B83724F|nr:RNA 2',3'-cyclic phosphodiesterase [Massilia sp. ST3]MBQ5947868.1 RNA 2',3'-cyclic phosphodiesterase [Massilia sp. ST3]
MSGQQETTRLFLALWPDPAIRHQLREWRDAWGWPRGATPVHTDKLHLTLHFLGNLPSSRLSELRDGFSVPFDPFRLELGRAVMWPRGLAVLEPHGEPPELLALHARLNEALVTLGLAPEARKYRPHVTMARRAVGAVPPTAGPAVTWEAQGYALVESRPGDGGGYIVLHDYGSPPA